MQAGSSRQLAAVPTGFCVMPFTGLQVGATGAVAPCCEFDGSFGHARDGLDAAWESPGWGELRERFLRGEAVDQCWKCVEQERHGGTSLRLLRREFEPLVLKHSSSATDASDRAERSVVVTADRQPRLLDLRFSNRCNLKCRTCWHGSSSRWFADARALGLEVGPVAEIESFAPGTVLDALSPVLATAEMIYFAGGEPLLAPDHGRLLRHLLDVGRTDVILEYNSNLMVRDVESWDVFELWAQFASVRVEASIDGVDEVGALVRSGFDWPTFARHVGELTRAVPTVELRFGVTVSALNVMHLDELIRTLLARWPDVAIRMHTVSSPSHYRLGVLPAAARAAAASALARLADELDGARTPGGLATQLRMVESALGEAAGVGDRERFREITRALDARRGESTAGVVPALAPALRRSRRDQLELRARAVVRRVVPAPLRRWRRAARRRRRVADVVA